MANNNPWIKPPFPWLPPRANKQKQTASNKEQTDSEQYPERLFETCVSLFGSHDVYGGSDSAMGSH
jgi:hypothetical protein